MKECKRDFCRQEKCFWEPDRRKLTQPGGMSLSLPEAFVILPKDHFLIGGTEPTKGRKTPKMNQTWRKNNSLLYLKTTTTPCESPPFKHIQVYRNWDFQYKNVTYLSNVFYLYMWCFWINTAAYMFMLHVTAEDC